MSTGPFSAFTSNLNPSMSDFNTLINQLNALFPDVTTTGNGSFSGNLSVTGTTSLTGNTTEAGTLTVTGLTTLNGGLAGGSSANIAINTNKFTVSASTGNTLVAGTFAVTGASTLSGLLTTSGHTARSHATELTAAGTTISDALQLTDDISNITTATSGTGVILSATGNEQIVFNNGTSPIMVYSAADTIDGTAGTTGVALTNGNRAVFIRVATNTLLSAQLGAASA
jgi:hypothetical protein